MFSGGIISQQFFLSYFVCFLIRDRKGVDLDERSGGEEVIVEGAKAVIRIYCMIFQSKEN